MSHHNQHGATAPSDESIIDLDLDDLDDLEDRWEEVGPTVYDALFIETRPDNNAPIHEGELDADVMTRLHATLTAVPLEQRVEDADKSLIEDLALIDSILQTGLRELDAQEHDIDATRARSVKLRWSPRPSRSAPRSASSSMKKTPSCSTTRILKRSSTRSPGPISTTGGRSRSGRLSWMSMN